MIAEVGSAIGVGVVASVLLKLVSQADWNLSFQRGSIEGARVLAVFFSVEKRECRDRSESPLLVSRTFLVVRAFSSGLLRWIINPPKESSFFNSERTRSRCSAL